MCIYPRTLPLRRSAVEHNRHCLLRTTCIQRGNLFNSCNNNKNINQISIIIHLSTLGVVEQTRCQNVLWVVFSRWTFWIIANISFFFFLLDRKWTLKPASFFPLSIGFHNKKFWFCFSVSKNNGSIRLAWLPTLIMSIIRLSLELFICYIDELNSILLLTKCFFSFFLSRDFFKSSKMECRSSSFIQQSKTFQIIKSWRLMSTFIYIFASA